MVCWQCYVDKREGCVFAVFPTTVCVCYGVCMMSRDGVGCFVVCVYIAVVCWVGIMCAVGEVITISPDGLLLLYW